MLKDINEAFFDNWTEESAYVIGYIWADGVLSKAKGHERIQISSTDKDIIEQIHKAMESDYSIVESSYGEGKMIYITGFSRPNMIAKLEELGLTERKSNTKLFPNVPREFLPHFIRGYFDGNGHFTYELKKKDGLKRKMHSGFTTGSELFAKGLANALHELGLKLANVHYVDRRGKGGYGEYYQFRYYVQDTVKLAELMYKGATIYMKRKKEYYDTKNGTL